jgi:large subunit ribosomal protein L25
MSEYQLFAEPREVKGKKVRQLRVQGYVPAVLYGAGIPTKSLQVATRDVERMLRDAGTTNLISVQIGSKGESHTAVVRDVQYDVISRAIQHVDFMQIVRGEKISIEVSIVLVGETSVTGTVYQDMNSVQIECLPSEMISSIEVDIASLVQEGDTITVKDLQVPDSITILADEDQLIAHTEALREVEEEEEPTVPAFEVGQVGLVSDLGSDAEDN